MNELTPRHKYTQINLFEPRQPNRNTLWQNQEAPDESDSLTAALSPEPKPKKKTAAREPVVIRKGPHIRPS